MNDDVCPMRGDEHLDAAAQACERVDEEAARLGEEAPHLLTDMSLQLFEDRIRDHYQADPYDRQFLHGMMAAVGLLTTAPLPGFLVEALQTGILDAIGMLRLKSGKAKTDAAFNDIISRLDNEEKGDDAAGYI